MRRCRVQPVRAVPSRKESQREVDDHEQQPQDHEPFGPALLPQPRQQDRRDGIQHNDGGDQPMYDGWSVYSMTRASCGVNGSASTKKLMLTAVTAPYVRKDRPLFSASLPAFPAKRK